MAFKLKSVEPSKRKFKKWKATFYDKDTGKTKASHFGDNRYEDYTMTGDKVRRAAYQSRHEKDLGNDAMSPGVLSYTLLWNKPTLAASIASYKKLYDM